MTKQEKKQVKEVIKQLADIQSDICDRIMQEQDRLDAIGDGISQLDRALKLEDNVNGLEDAEDYLGRAIEALEEIVS